MTRNSLANAKAELYGLVSGANLPAGVAAAYQYEPIGGHMQKPVAVTLFTSGMTPTEYLLTLRIYVTTDVDAKTAQDTMDTLIEMIDNQMTSGFGPSDWEVVLDQEIAALVATNRLRVGRED
jgi:hypothetical protein